MGQMIQVFLGLIIFAGLYLSVPSAAYADAAYTFSCPESVIKGSISYSVIGTYRSIFEDCSGKVVYDGLRRQVKSVMFTITTASIKSNCEWCDNIVRSKRILDDKVYPVITFKSDKFERKDDSFLVAGIVDLHGVIKNLHSSFALQEQNDNTLFLTGTWELRRKDFNIIWSRWLDYGGILVGNYMTVDWQVKAHKI